MDADAARQFWNSRYDRPDYLFGEAPNAFLASQSGRLTPLTPPTSPNVRDPAPHKDKVSLDRQPFMRRYVALRS